MATALRFFYRRLYVTGLETIARKGPVIIIANHTSSLMDAALLGVLIHRPVHFFTRADVFSGKLFSKFLGALNMIPIINHNGGRKTLAANKDSFTKAEQILARGGIVVFFPEGISHTERRLMPLRKGVFRLAFQAAVRDNFKTNIPVVPAGINYSHPSACQAEVMIHFGTPLMLNDYREAYLVNPAASLLQITKDGYAALQQNALYIDDAARYDLVDSCLKIKRNDYAFFTRQWMQGTRRRLEEERYICRYIDELVYAEQSVLRKNNSDYLQLLQLYKIRDKALSPLFKVSCCKKLLLLLGSPLFIIGYLLNYLPIKIARKITEAKVYRLDFFSWIFVACAIFFYLLWLIALFVGFSAPGIAYAICIVLLTVTGGIFTHYYLQCYNDYIQVKRISKLQQEAPGVLALLKAQRKKIIEMM